MEHAYRDEVSDDGGEGGSDGKQEPAVSLPEFAEAGSLSEDICDVGGAVGYVGYHRQQEKTQSEIKREYCPGRGISGCEVDDHDGSEGQVVDQPPTFPEFDGIGNVVSQVGSVHGNNSTVTIATPLDSLFLYGAQHILGQQLFGLLVHAARAVICARYYDRH